MLVILSTHPIQYQVPLWQELARDGRIPFEVWYLTRQATDISHDREFGTAFAWDLDMLSGYPHRFLDVAPGATPNDFWKCRVHVNLAELLREAKAKAIWVQGWQVAGYWQAVWAAKKAGAEVWLRGESNDLASTPVWKRAIKHLVLGKFLRRVDRFLYIGKANRRLYEKFGVAEDRLYPAPYAVDNERFARRALEIRDSRFEIRDSWRIPRDAFCVLFCGKFIPKKRPLDLVKAAKLFLASGSKLQSPSSSPTKLHLLFVGSGELGGAMRAHCDVVFDVESAQALINQEPIRQRTDSPPRAVALSEPEAWRITSNGKPRASFAGFLNQTEISKAYVAADCLVLPTDYRETWGLVVNEAMASGLPCLISDQCGCAEDLRSLGSNKIFSCGNVCELAERLRAVAELKTEDPIMSSQLPTFAETVSTVGLLYSALSFDPREIGR